jgi:DNA invertase Pin-like site-specific DNA recombinase
MFNIFSSLAQFERRLIQERTRAGLSAARARGRKAIRPDDPRVKTAKRMHKDHGMSID